MERRDLFLCAALVGGCFDDLRDRRCEADDDCFQGERCPSGRCVTVVSIGDADAEPAPETVLVLVEARRAGEEGAIAEAQINAAVGTPCNCRPRDTGGTSCAFEVPPDAPQTFCAVVRGYRPCAVVVPPEELGTGARVVVELSPCDAPDCTEPLACDCATVPACGTEEAR